MANHQHQAKETMNQGKEIAQNLKSDVKEAGAKAMKQAQDAAPELSERVWGAVSDIKGQLADYAGSGKEYVGQYVGQGESLIKKYPFIAIAGAVAVGTVIGGLLFRSSSKVA